MKTFVDLLSSIFLISTNPSCAVFLAESSFGLNRASYVEGKVVLCIYWILFSTSQHCAANLCSFFQQTVPATRDLTNNVSICTVID
jgi:hypothetical protein